MALNSYSLPIVFTFNYTRYNSGEQLFGIGKRNSSSSVAWNN